MVTFDYYTRGSWLSCLRRNKTGHNKSKVTGKNNLSILISCEKKSKSKEVFWCLGILMDT
jgi:hypothetical protein